MDLLIGMNRFLCSLFQLEYFFCSLNPANDSNIFGSTIAVTIATLIDEFCVVPLEGEGKVQTYSNAAKGVLKLSDLLISTKIGQL